MLYQVRILKGEAVSCIPDSLRKSGEIYYSVFDGAANITVEEDNTGNAIKKAMEIYKRSLKIE